MENSQLTHLDSSGSARMVDVSTKDITTREATAQSKVFLKKETLELITQGNIPKGDVFASARIAGIMAAKETHRLIPLCHPLPITAVTIEINADNSADEPNIIIAATVRVNSQTGVEMEALTAASIAALTIYDMCKAVDRGMTISDVKLLKKSGGRSGSYQSE
jgi:cyclic pyranopterin phosphate synthase|tara:strand:- start:2169 stop:2657 length:489 start_codon:yes stop_codon:yes gene_type:complete